MRRRRFITIAGGGMLAAGIYGTPTAAAGPPSRRNSPERPQISLRPMLTPGGLFDMKSGPAVTIHGTVRDSTLRSVRVRVTSTRGASSELQIPVQDGAFRVVYPHDFPGAHSLEPGMLFVDAANPDARADSQPGANAAEAAIIVHDSHHGLIPEMPFAFTGGLIDRGGHTDERCRQWPVTRALVNLFFVSQAARMIGLARPGWDLSHEGDLRYFKNNLALYEFDHRDRDWSRPLGHRCRRTFWQSVWNTWFNSSNDNPVDGDPANNSPSNYVPYVFTNDFADILILAIMRRKSASPLEDNLTTVCREGAENLMAMQYRGPGNFALRDHRGTRETYTAGAFRYGMFENGAYMTEGTGWFYNPAFLDYAGGGVLNGRAVWALGESIRSEPDGPLAERLKSALTEAIRFCLHDAEAAGYAHRTRNGRVYWRDAGEHAYLLLGMLAACEAAPSLTVLKSDSSEPVTLRSACASALDALIDLESEDHQWATYPNVDSMAIAALSEGAILLRRHPNAAKWRDGATAAADAWMAAKVDPKEYPAPVIHFGLRLKPDEMTFNWSRLAPNLPDRNIIYLYQTGHWIQALATLYALTGYQRYLKRTEAMIGYLCGANPWGVRLLNELGGVYNWVEDTDGDGIEDYLKQDLYPESTAYCQIGILRLVGNKTHEIKRTAG